MSLHDHPDIPTADALTWASAPVPRPSRLDVLRCTEAETLAYVRSVEADRDTYRDLAFEALAQLHVTTTRLQAATVVIRELRRRPSPAAVHPPYDLDTKSLFLERPS